MFGGCVGMIQHILFKFKCMKNLLLFSLLSLIIFSCGPQMRKQEQSSKPQPQPRVTTQLEWLTGTQHDFGVYVEREPKDFGFVFRNVGKVPFVIDSVVTACGCTQTKYKKSPVQPGDVDTIRVVYSGNGFVPGYFHQTCTVFGNISAPVELKLKGVFDHAE